MTGVIIGTPRLATLDDVPALEQLIDASVRGLNQGLYDEAQIESALRHVFGPDTALIRDGTYYAIDGARADATAEPAPEAGRTLAAAGGWGRRRTLFGGDQMRQSGEDPPLDPATEPARIRAFYVHPAFARRGLARALFETCRAAARGAGFRRFELAATLPGVPLYVALGFTAIERVEVALPGGVRFPVVRMERPIEG